MCEYVVEEHAIAAHSHFTHAFTFTPLKTRSVVKKVEECVASRVVVVVVILVGAVSALLCALVGSRSSVVVHYFSC